MSIELKPRLNSRLIRAALGVASLAAIAWLLAGCATQPATKKNKGYTFFPGPPDPPRLQFLTSYASEKELRGGASTFASFVTGETQVKNPILKPYGVALRAKELFVCDTALHAVLILDLAKQRMRGLAPRGEAALKGPVNITLDAEGNRYVVDTVRNQVLIFDANDAYKGAIGAKDEMKPRDVVVGKERFYVADVQNHCVRVYDKADRKLLFSIPKEKEAENISTRLYQPTNLALDSQGRLYACDTGAFRVQQYDAEGNFLRSFGHNGDAPGEFKMPKGVAVDREGRVLVVDAANQVIQIFDDQARLLMWFGEPDTSDAGLDLPAKVIVDYDHVGLFQSYAAPNFKLEYLVIVTNQFGPRKVGIYGFGHKK
jgi:sugar lactone lactonase YvrE